MPAPDTSSDVVDSEGSHDFMKGILSRRQYVEIRFCDFLVILCFVFPLWFESFKISFLVTVSPRSVSVTINCSKLAKTLDHVGCVSCEAVS